MNEFVSKLEELISAEELLFDSTPGFGSVYKNFLGHSIAHPAKMNTRLTEFLIEKFTEEGDVVLDPMAGSGQTGVIAALRGRDSVCVELEEKFFGWMEKARLKVERQRTLAVKGEIQNVCGDARKLSELLKDVDVVLTSPPFTSTTIQKDFKNEKELEEFAKKQWVFRHGRSLEATKRFIKKSWKGYPPNPENIGNLHHGQIDAIVTSPPYKTANEGGGLNKNPPKTFRGVLKNHSFKISDNPENIDNLPYPTKVDVIVTSPPYAETESFQDVDFMKKIQKDQSEKLRKGEVKGHFKTEAAALKEFDKIEKGRIENVDNIGNLPFADAVITSPPYEGSLEDRKGGGILTREGAGPNSEATTTQNLLPCKYSSSKENIGNLKKQTYLEAMLQVYSEMFKVLKPNGKAIIIIKPFIRNKKVVDLPFHTWLLLKKAGFELAKLFTLRLKTQSFWRVLYHKKYPKVPQIQHEYILVCQKAGCG